MASSFTSHSPSSESSSSPGSASSPSPSSPSPRSMERSSPAAESRPRSCRARRALPALPASDLSTGVLHAGMPGRGGPEHKGGGWVNVGLSVRALSCGSRVHSADVQARGRSADDPSLTRGSEDLRLQRRLVASAPRAVQRDVPALLGALVVRTLEAIHVGHLSRARGGSASLPALHGDAAIPRHHPRCAPPPPACLEHALQRHARLVRGLAVGHAREQQLLHLGAAAHVHVLGGRHARHRPAAEPLLRLALVPLGELLRVCQVLPVAHGGGGVRRGGARRQRVGRAVCFAAARAPSPNRDVELAAQAA